MKQRLTSDIMANLGDMPSEQLKAIENAVTISLHDYDVVKAETSVTIYEGDQTEYYIKKFLVAKRVQGCTDRTLKNYSGSIPRMLQKMGKPAVQVTTDDIRYYLATREIKDGIRKTTIDNELRYLKTFYNFMVDEDFITKNPAAKIGKIRGPKLKKKALNDLEIEKLRDACDSNKKLAILEMLLSTGCRATELVNIKRTDINGTAIVTKRIILQ